MAERWPETKAGRLLGALEAKYGAPASLVFSGPYEMVLWEIVGYMAEDARRGAAFAGLRERVGLAPERILAAPLDVLREVTRMGGAIAFEERAGRLLRAAEFALEDGDSILTLPPQKAKKRLMRYPMIGEPGAEKILLFCGRLAVLALESNGLRVLTRVGIGSAGKSYSATYRSVREATLEQLPADVALLQTAHLLLRRHGREVCLQNGPACGACAARAMCPAAVISG